MCVCVCVCVVYVCVCVCTVVLEKKGSFFCEILMERYIYLRNTQNQLKITIYLQYKSFFEFYLDYNGVCLKLLGSVFKRLGDFVSLCIKIGG